VQRFRYVTLPTISPVLLFAVITSVIQTLQYFTQAVVASQVAQGNSNITASSLVLGYPSQSTLTFPAWLYTKGFQDFNMGYASTLAVLLFVVTLVFTTILLRRRGGFNPDGAS
jgi:multiple sugar transport system permease protein